MICMEKLFKSRGVLWEVSFNDYGVAYINGQTYCPKQGCRTLLSQEKGGYCCVGCGESYTCEKDYGTLKSDVDKIFQGNLRSDWEVVSLDLPPTVAWNEDKSDGQYWVKAKIGQKDGKKQVVVFVGEKLRSQTTKDYVQMFVDIDESQLRFDKGNQNPLRLLTIVQAEFIDAKVVIKKKNNLD